MAVYCREFTSLIPITFVMGFYVWIVVDRWWKQYMAIPWPDKYRRFTTYLIFINDRFNKKNRFAGDGRARVIVT